MKQLIHMCSCFCKPVLTERDSLSLKDQYCFLLPFKELAIYLNRRVFNPHQDEYFPIPQAEIEKSNGSLKQNPGY